jgi:site-specific DNA-adenine methylase
MIRKYRLHEFIPRCGHDYPYSELFLGSGVMFFNLYDKYMHAYLNDSDGDLVNFWIQMQKNYASIENKLKYVWSSSNNIDWGLNLDDPIDKAVHFYLAAANTSYITKPVQIHKNLSNWAIVLDKSRVFIDNKSFDEEMEMLMKLYNKNDPKRPCWVNFYEDPPYYGMESVYNETKKGKFDHELLAEKNKEAAEKGHVIILSYNKCPEIEALYDGWFVKEFPMAKNGGKSTYTERIELLISNKPLIRHRKKQQDLHTFIKKPIIHQKIEPETESFSLLD